LRTDFSLPRLPVTKAFENNKERKMANKQRGGSSNFANDPERASEAGKKGSQKQQGGSKGQQQGSGQPGRRGNFADDPGRASEAGRKGGQS
jgi:uncharacterized protein